MYTGVGYGAKLGPIGKRIVLPSREILKSVFEIRVFARKRPELGALGDLYCYISKSLKSLKTYAKGKS
jgi:hypothetical protein